jgi:glycosyltransferase involved in cell wall biosynthesis
MKISILTPELSNNCLGRAYLLAKLLQSCHKIEIIGPLSGKEIWSPVADDKSVPYGIVRINDRFSAYRRLLELLKRVRGDCIYVSKPLLTSFGVGLIKQFSGRRPLILDIDDWQLGFRKQAVRNLSFWRSCRYWFSSTLFVYSLGSYWNSLSCEKMICLADDITVSNNFLKSRFGGTVVWHARDTEVFDPKKYMLNAMRSKYGISKDLKTVMFLGSPLPHKGVEELINAIRLIDHKDIVLVIVGLGESRYCQYVRSLGNRTLGKRFIGFGIQSFEKVPEFLTLADVVVVPQRKSTATAMQVPAKIFDAMAMAKPIVSTDVGDIPNILDDCGWIVEPENHQQLAAAILDILNDPDGAIEKGWKARNKCVEMFSLTAMQKVVTKLFSKYE